YYLRSPQYLQGRQSGTRVESLLSGGYKGPPPPLPRTLRRRLYSAEPNIRVCPPFARKALWESWPPSPPPPPAPSGPPLSQPLHRLGEMSRRRPVRRARA